MSEIDNGERFIRKMLGPSFVDSFALFPSDKQRGFMLEFLSHGLSLLQIRFYPQFQLVITNS